LTNSLCRFGTSLAPFVFLSLGCASAPAAVNPSTSGSPTKQDDVAAAGDDAGTKGPATAIDFDITLAHQSEREKETRSQLERLARAFDLTPWLFTKTIVIDEEAIPHSHPVLTLHTKHLKEDDQLLSTFIHEQLHWWMIAQGEKTEAAVGDLRAGFPSLPVGYPDGADSERSNYVHLSLIYLEYEGLNRFVGKARARATFTYWEKDHYRALYRIFRVREREIAKITQSRGLVPPFLMSKSQLAGAT
jgi:hypothetical protein